MIKKTIKYTDYNDVERSEDYFFHLTKAEILETEMGTEGGLSSYLKSIINTQDVPSLMKIFKELVLRSYGEKSPDGKSFIKYDINGNRLSNKFMQTEAFSSLFMELATNTDAAIEFVNGLIPKDMRTTDSKKLIQEVATGKKSIEDIANNIK